MSIGPLINGHRFSYSSIELAVATITKPLQIITDIQELSYSEALDISYVRGTSRAPIGWTAGQYEPGDGSLTMGKSSFQSLVQSIGPGWMGINLNMLASYNDIGEPLCVDTIVARISGADESYASGPDMLSVKVALKIFSILRNGVPALLNRVF